MKFTRTILVLVCIIPIVAVLMAAGNASKYDAIRNQAQKSLDKTPGPDGRTVKLADYQFPDNSKSNKLLPMDHMQGYAAKLSSPTAQRVSEQLMTYRQYVDKYTDGQVAHYIDPNRMVWVFVTRYPDGVKTDHGDIANAEVIVVADAETGKYLGADTRSRDYKK